jgi:glucosamine-6-phosphate deaminase
MLESQHGLMPRAEIAHPDIRDIRNYGPEYNAAAAAGLEIVLAAGKYKTGGIAFATGKTQEPVLAQAANYAREMGISFAGITGYHQDERYPLTPDTVASAFAREIYLNAAVPLGIPPEQMRYWNGFAADPTDEANRYNHLLEQQHLILSILGIGPPGKHNPAIGGHIMFNESGTPFDAQCHYVPDLAQETRDRDRIERHENIPNGALTQGLGNLKLYDHILLIAFGTQKGIALRHALWDEISPSRPASILRLPELREKTTIIVDQMASAEILAARV